LPSQENLQKSLKMPRINSIAMAVGARFDTPDCVKPIFCTKLGHALFPSCYQCGGGLPALGGAACAQS
jgi:hypothetical protein